MSLNPNIPKVANTTTNYLRPYYNYINARTAWEDILLHYSKTLENLTVLIPSYIGFSVHEGSGIFDPIEKQSIAFEFYALNKELHIEIDDLRHQVKNTHGNVMVLLVHYFGFIDHRYKEICDWLDKEDIIYVEDCAHAMLSDVVGGICGRRGQHSFYSLHKLFPFKNGGLLVNNGIENDFNPSLNLTPQAKVYNYDLKSIFDKRRYNFEYLTKALSNIDGIKLLKSQLLNGECPQTLPVLILNGNRDTIYFEMNKQGVGMVSLYHTMIEQLHDKNYESSSYTSKNLINFPIHQDVSQSQLEGMVELFKTILIDS